MTTVTSKNGTTFDLWINGDTVQARAKGLDLGEVKEIPAMGFRAANPVDAAGGKKIEAYFAGDDLKAVSATFEALMSEAQKQAQQARLDEAAFDAKIERGMDAHGDCASRGERFSD